MISRRFLATALMAFAFTAARADQQWVQVDSPHFSVATDGGEKRAREVAQRFEQMRTAFGAMFQKVSVNTAPLQIIAFRNGKELRQFAPLYQGKPIEIAGFFLGDGGHGGTASGERQYIALDLSAENNWQTVFHEYAHLLINSNFPPAPVWFDEGFAEYCSSLKMDKKEIALGLTSPVQSRVLSENSWLPIVQLFSVRHDSQIYNRDDRRFVFYAQSWITVHFLMGKGLLKQANNYITLTQNQHVPVADAIRQSFGMEPEALQKAVEAYFRTGVLYYHVAAPPGSDNISFSSHPLNDLDVKSVFADLDYHARDYRARGINEFKEILAAQPDNFVANRGLGLEAMHSRDWKQAAEYFKRAAGQDSKDAQVHYWLAFVLNREGGRAASAEDHATIRKELNMAVNLDPNYADAYNLLGMNLSMGGEKEAAIAALTKAIQLNPRNLYYYGNLANVYLRSRDFDRAIPLLQQLQKNSDPQIAAMATQQLQQAETMRAYMSNRSTTSANIEPAATPTEKEVAATASTQPSTAAAAVSFMKGTLLSVDCSSAPAATLTIVSSGKQWKMLTPEAKKLVLIGADEFSCTWKNRKIAVNFRKNSDNEGTLLSLELE
jgi:tetratricopeptide (TPR) repeat protein